MSIEHAKLKLSQVDAGVSAIEAERTARLLAKGCTADELADLLAGALTAQQQTLRTLQDIETRVFVANRALELHRYREDNRP